MHKYVIQGPYFIWQLPFVTSHCYSAVHASGWLSGLWQHDKQPDGIGDWKLSGKIMSHSSVELRGESICTALCPFPALWECWVLHCARFTGSDRDYWSKHSWQAGCHPVCWCHHHEQCVWVLHGTWGTDFNMEISEANHKTWNFVSHCTASRRIIFTPPGKCVTNIQHWLSETFVPCWRCNED